MDTIQDELRLFRKRQAEASNLQEIRQVFFPSFPSPSIINQEKSRERILFQEWQDSKRASSANTNSESEGESIPVFIKFHSFLNLCPVVESGFRVTSSLYASVWKITCDPGDIISSASDVVLILEAMKTEIPVTAGEDNVGRRVYRLGKEVKEGASVRPGDVLVVFV